MPLRNLNFFLTNRPRRQWEILLLVGVVTCLASCRETRRDSSSFDLPDVMLWAWERPEHLDFLPAKSAGVAFLAGTARIATNGSVLFRMRTQALTLRPDVALLPVVRVESPSVHAPAEIAGLLPGLEGAANLPGVRGLQIDFDARRSERAFYRVLLESLANKTSKPISVTALASWCEGDRWLDREPIAEAVPMLFRMGRGESREMDLQSTVCRSSIGLSTDEPWPAQRPGGHKRIYLFDPRPWTEEDYTRARKRIEQWR